jgi:hypothetical protein
MEICVKCGRVATMHVTEINQETGQVEEFHLCHLHALEFPPEAGGFPRETAGAQSPMTDPVGLASKFVGEMQLAGYVLRAEGEAVSVAPSDEPQFFVLYHSQKLRHLVGQWLAKKGISRKTDEINDVASAILSLLRQR